MPKSGVAVAFPAGALSGVVEDCTVQVGTTSYPLSECQAIYPTGDRPGAMLKSGKRVAGPIRGLEAVAVFIGEQKLTVNLSAAEEITMHDLNADPVVVLELVAKRDGKELASVSRTIFLDEASKVYLAELEPFETRFGPWPFGKGTLGNNPQNSPISFKGKPYPKGLGLHANNNPTPSMVKYSLNKTASIFRTAVAYDDSNEGKVTGPTHFEVYGDGKLLWKSKEITTHKQMDECVINVIGVEVLELRVGVTGSGWGAHAIWLDPILVGPNAAAIRKAAGKK
jgi:hypothetical protein